MCAAQITSALTWPNAAHFAMVMQNPRIAFRDAELQQITITTDHNSQPRAWAGSFANVYEGTFPSGRKRAVRVFTSGLPERRERYQAIAKHLENRHLRSLVDFTYEDRGVRSGGDGKWYPLVTMDWVSGETLYDWVRHKCLNQNAKAISRISDQWIDTIQELTSAKIAHGDLQHGNVMIAVTGELKLVDYDCMCVPALVGRKNLEIGVDPYQHPQRNEDTLLSLELDNFSALFILVALKALAASPDLWNTYVERSQYDKLLFRHEDLHAPQQSDLLRALRRSPDHDVQRLSQELVDLARVRIDQVPRLEQVLFSFSSVEVKLNQRDFDGAIELLTRNQKRIADAPPALQPRLQDAEQRIRHRLELEKAVQAGDEAAMQRLYAPRLLDDYPRAQPSVAIAKTAPQVLPLLQRLQSTSQAKSWRDFVQIWDANRLLLANRKSAETFAPLADSWRERNRACDLLIGLVKQPNCNAAALENAARQLEKLGWHPDADPYRPQVEQVVKRGRAWSAFQQALQRGGEEGDSLIVRAWNDAIFTGWDHAERQRPRLVQAQKRLALLEQIRQQAAQPLALCSEKALVKLAKPLPADYAYHLQPRVQQARERIEALRQLQEGLRQPVSDSAVVAACQAIDRLQGRGLVPDSWLPHVATAEQRAPLLAALKKIPPDYPPAQAPNYDRKLLETWQDDLLCDCPDAQPWAAAYQAAQQRKEAYADFEAAIAAADKTRIVEVFERPCLQGVPLPRDWIEQAQRARVDVLAARNLLQALTGDEQARFLELFDARIIRQNAVAFEPHQARLREWLPTEILPAGKLAIGPPVAARAVQKKSDTHDVFNFSWNWPAPRFSEECVLAICRDKPRMGDDPRKYPGYVRQWIDRKRYEEGSGSVMIHANEQWLRGYAVVWAAIDLGFDVFFSEPVVLGRLSEPAAGTKAKKKGWFVL